MRSKQGLVSSPRQFAMNGTPTACAAATALAEKKAAEKNIEADFDGELQVDAALVPEIAAPGFDPQPAIDFWDLTNRQDWELCANAHKGVASNAWEPGPYSELESQLAAFDRQYLRALSPDLPAMARRRA